VLVGLIGGLMIGILTALVFGLTQGALTGWVMGINAALDYGSKYSLMFGLIVGIGFMIGGRLHEIKMIDHLAWDWKRAKTGSLIGFIVGLLGGIVIALIRYWIILELIKTFPEMGKGENLSIFGMVEGACIAGLTVGFLGGVFGLAIGGISGKQTEYTLYPGQKISSSTKNFFFVFLWLGLGIWLTFGLVGGMGDPLGMFLFGAYVAPLTGLLIGLLFGGLAIAQHYALRLVLTLKKNLPIQLPPFLDHCVDLIFLRRVGGGYIFVHRLLMEHFAEMYVETPTSKGN
jgi:hypothetical protein